MVLVSSAIVMEVGVAPVSFFPAQSRLPQDPTRLLLGLPLEQVAQSIQSARLLAAASEGPHRGRGVQVHPEGAVLPAAVWEVLEAQARRAIQVAQAMELTQQQEVAVDQTAWVQMARLWAAMVGPEHRLR